jgi:hypothetical protein
MNGMGRKFLLGAFCFATALAGFLMGQPAPSYAQLITEGGGTNANNPQLVSGLTAALSRSLGNRGDVLVWVIDGASPSDCSSGSGSSIAFCLPDGVGGWEAYVAPAGGDTNAKTLCADGTVLLGEDVTRCEALVTCTAAEAVTWDGTDFGCVALDITVVGETPTGTKDGANKTFTIAFTPPDPDRLDVTFSGFRLEKVGSGPDVTQFSLAGDTLSLGLAPASNDVLAVTYTK